ncbi:MAG TPA: 2-dehydropantoate 2-reductase [Tahibacter sp.]|nr:2-dehydropantoate 2-reductase [Tahibacter sp.]
MSAPTIAVFGAGSIGCYVGGRLAASGATVRFVGRERLKFALAEHGLRVSDYLGYDATLTHVDYATDADAVRDADLVLVTVKSAATGDAARELAPRLKADARVVSFQNGLGNADALAAALPAHRVVAGMVPFNVLQRAPGWFHQGTEGRLDVARDAALAPFRDAFAHAGLPLVEHDDMPAVQWSKLLLNLNNAINALSGVPLKTQLAQRGYRRCLAAAQVEALHLLDAAGIAPATITALPPYRIPRVLSLPDWLFRLVARRMLAIDPVARSSMWEDLEAGRATEVDWLNGEVVRLAQRLGRHAPVNAQLAKLVHDAEQGGRRAWTADDLWNAIKSDVAPP